MRFLKELDRRERGMLYRRWRPKVPVSKQYVSDSEPGSTAASAVARSG